MSGLLSQYASWKFQFRRCGCRVADSSCAASAGVQANFDSARHKLGSRFAARHANHVTAEFRRFRETAKADLATQAKNARRRFAARTWASTAAKEQAPKRPRAIRRSRLAKPIRIDRS